MTQIVVLAYKLGFIARFVHKTSKRQTPSKYKRSHCDLRMQLLPT